MRANAQLRRRHGTAFECYDSWSACSSKYEGSEATRKKFDEVPAEYKGEAIAVTLDMLHWRARRRAENVIRAVYFPKIGPIAEAFKTLPIENLGADLICPKGGEPIPPGSVGPKDGLTALEYLSVLLERTRTRRIRKSPPTCSKKHAS